MQNAALLSFHWNWLQLVLLCVIVPTTNYIVDATQTRRRRKKCQFPVKEIHSNLLFSFQTCGVTVNAAAFFFFFPAKQYRFLSGLSGQRRCKIQHSEQPFVLHRLFLFIRVVFLSESVSDTNNFVLLSCWLIVSPGLFKSVSRCLSPILE